MKNNEKLWKKQWGIMKNYETNNEKPMKHNEKQRKRRKNNEKQWNIEKEKKTPWKTMNKREKEWKKKWKTINNRDKENETNNENNEK